jgi:glycosyltransferase involved in cell wall biosynthesis
MRLSVVIPSYRDPLLFKTIRSILDNSGLPDDQIEIIAVLDGYYPAADLIIQDPRVRYVHLGANRGMRGAINAGVALAQGEFIMRSDEHIMYGPNFAKILTDSCQPNWIMTATRYFLDPVKWERMDIEPFVYEKLKIRGGENGEDMKFEGQRWKSRTKERKDIMIDETMATQGSFWLMPRKWWHDVIGELQIEGYGPHFQDSHEMIFKTWKAGGKLMINKNTWFAHKHYSFPRSHQEGTKENPGIADQSYEYCLKVWKDYYINEVLPKWFPSS